jgi:hypothetical protein
MNEEMEVHEDEVTIRTAIQAGDGQVLGSGSATSGPPEDERSGGFLGSGN